MTNPNFCSFVSVSFSPAPFSNPPRRRLQLHSSSTAPGSSISILQQASTPQRSSRIPDLHSPSSIAAFSSSSLSQQASVSQPGPFDLLGTIVYKIDQQRYQSVFYDGTIEVVEAGGFLSIESVFLVTLGVALIGLFGLWAYGQMQQF